MNKPVCFCYERVDELTVVNFAERSCTHYKLTRFGPNIAPEESFHDNTDGIADKLLETGEEVCCYRGEYNPENPHAPYISLRDRRISVHGAVSDKDELLIIARSLQGKLSCLIRKEADETYLREHPGCPLPA